MLYMYLNFRLWVYAPGDFPVVVPECLPAESAFVAVIHLSRLFQLIFNDLFIYSRVCNPPICLRHTSRSLQSGSTAPTGLWAVSAFGSWNHSTVTSV